jgi:pilus assembly protein CpaE
MQQQTIQLAVITEYPYRSEMLEYLAVGKGWKVLVISGQDDPAAKLRSQPADLVIVDLEWPDAIALLGELSRMLPKTPLLALATPGHLTELQEARLAGAVDFVAFPINHQHFFATVERALQPAAPAPAVAPQQGSLQGQLIAIASLKGGAGRSTLAANLAVALRQSQAGEVILAEAHHGLGQLALTLNLHPRYTVANLVSESTIDADLLRGYLQAHQSGVRLLAAPSEPTQLAELNDTIWQRVLTLLTELAPNVVVDTTMTADSVLSQVLIHSSQILLLVEPTIASLYSARALIETLRNEQEIRASMHVVLNQADRSGGLGAAVIEKHLGEPIALSLPFDPSLVTFTVNRGVPFITSHPRALISRRVQQLADKLLKKTPASEAHPSERKAPIFSSLLSVARR